MPCDVNKFGARTALDTFLSDPDGKRVVLTVHLHLLPCDVNKFGARTALDTFLSDPDGKRVVLTVHLPYAWIHERGCEHWQRTHKLKRGGMIAMRRT
jgi:hypothetical protein